MTILTWALRLVLFAVLLAFALQNADPVNLHLLPGLTWQAPLVIVLLLFFAGGAVAGVLALLGVIFRQRREISRLKRAAEVPQASPEPMPPQTV